MESDSQGAPNYLWSVNAFGREAFDGFQSLIEVSASELARAALTALAVLTVVLWRRYSRGRKIAACLKSHKEDLDYDLEVLNRVVSKYLKKEQDKASSSSADDDAAGNGGNQAKADDGQPSADETAGTKGDGQASTEETTSTKGDGQAASEETTSAKGDGQAATEETSTKDSNSSTNGEGHRARASGILQRNGEVNPVYANGPTTQETSSAGERSNPSSDEVEARSFPTVDSIVEGAESKPCVSDNSSPIVSSQQLTTADESTKQADKATDVQVEAAQAQARGEPEWISRPTELSEESDDSSRTSSLDDREGANGSENREVLDAIPSKEGGVQGGGSKPAPEIRDGVVLISSAVHPSVDKRHVHENGITEELSTHHENGETNGGTLSPCHDHGVSQGEIPNSENGVSSGANKEVPELGTEDDTASKRKDLQGHGLENGHGCLENGGSEGHKGDVSANFSSICENGFSERLGSSKSRAYKNPTANGHAIVSSVGSTGSQENGTERTGRLQQDQSNSCGAHLSEGDSSPCVVQDTKRMGGTECDTSTKGGPAEGEASSSAISRDDEGRESKKVRRTEDDLFKVEAREERDKDSAAAAVSLVENDKKTNENCLADLTDVDNVKNTNENESSLTILKEEGSKSKKAKVGKPEGATASPEKPSPPSILDVKCASDPKEGTADEETNARDETDAEQDGKKNGDESELRPGTAPITIFLPSPVVPDKDLKPIIDLLKKISLAPPAFSGNVWSILHGSLQTRVEVNDKLMGKLSDLLIQGTKYDKLCTIQLGRRAILQSSENGMQVFNLGESSVPTIISVEYAAGVLVIMGLHLEGAVIKATMKRKTIPLNMNLREKKAGGLEVMSCVEPMPSRDIQEVFIFASNTVELEGRKFTVVSRLAFIDETHLKTALRDWIPTSVMAVLLAREIWMIIRPLIRVAIQYGTWILPAAAIVILQFLPTRTEDCIGEWVRSVVVCSKLSVQGALRFMRSKSKLESSSFKPPPPPLPKPPPPPPPGALEVKPKTTPEKPITDLDWQWPSFDEYVDKGLPKLKEHTATPDAKNSPFQAIYKREAEQQWADVVSINFSSPILIKIVQSFLPHKKDMLYMEKPSVKGKELFLIMDQLIGYTVTDEDQNSLEEKASLDMETCKLHLYHLVRFVKKEYNDVVVRFNRMRDEKSVSWDMLWAFLGPGTKVAYTCSTSEEKLLAKVKTTNFQFCAFRKNNWTLSVVLEVYDYNGESYRKCTLNKSIDQFDGEQEFVSLDVCPVEFSEDPEGLEASCIQNGRKFREYVMSEKHRYVHYKGPIFQLRNAGGMWTLYSANADGRLMIDLESFAKMNPKYPMGNAKPSSTLLRSISNHVPKAVMDNATDANLLYAPAIVYGFSFSQKQWGAFTVSGLTDITFNGNAYEELVMESEEKALMYNLVSQYIAPTPRDDADKTPRVDPISNKGEGCIFLCYGPPGTGKTLTAESVAEKLQRPLWALSVCELGTSADKLESSLVRVLDIAASWRAVLLLDEADVYLELRKTTDIHRNAMTGVFLRLLEYYRGVLFLTTNRVLTFDDAFLSRISMFLNYKKLEQMQRQQIWAKLLRRAGVVDLTPEFVSELASQDHQGLNGRAIRNVVQTAQTWAKSKQEPLSAKHIKHVLKVTTSSLGSLHTAMGMTDLTPFYYT